MQNFEALQFLLLTLVGLIGRRQQRVVDYLIIENRILKARLQKELGGRRLLLTVSEKRKLAIKARAVGSKDLKKIACIVTPDTLLRWFRELVAKKYDSSQNRKLGRPWTSAETRDLVLNMAIENPGWGCTRIAGALKNLDIKIGRSTVRRILIEYGLEPAPERNKKTSWHTFIKSHLGQIAATDFFTVEVLTLFGIVRYSVLFVIDIESRLVHIAGIIRDPHGAWMKQIAKNLTDPWGGFLIDKSYLIHDRDPLFTKDFKEVLKQSGIETVRLPSKSPNLNAFAERFVLSIKGECLNKIIPLGERHLETAVREYVRHYNSERNHQGLGNELITPISSNIDPNSPIKCHSRFGGLLNYYYRSAS